MRLPREARLAGLGACSYDLGFKIFRGKVVETKLWSEGDTSQQSHPVALGFRLRRASIVNLHCLHGQDGHHFRRRCPSLDTQDGSPWQAALLVLLR